MFNAQDKNVQCTRQKCSIHKNRRTTSLTKFSKCLELSYKRFIFAQKAQKAMETSIREKIRDTALSIIPQNARVILFGSRARGDWNNASDLDLLILIDKNKIEEKDHELYAYPFWELGWETGEMIHPIIYTFTEWKQHKDSAFYKNIDKEGINIC